MKWLYWKIRGEISKLLFRLSLMRSQVSSSFILKFFFLSLFKKETITARVWGRNIKVRPGTFDLYVAVSSVKDLRDFTGQFDFDEGFIIDAGGYIGTSAVELATRYPRCTIVSIEPHSDNFRMLKENTKRYANIVPIHAALSGKRGTAPLMDRGTGLWGYTIRGEGRIVGTVPTITINDILEQFGTDTINLFKIDIEGGETNLLKDTGWIKKTKVIMIELHGDEATRMFDEAVKGRTGAVSIKRNRVSIRQPL